MIRSISVEPRVIGRGVMRSLRSLVAVTALLLVVAPENARAAVPEEAVPAPGVAADGKLSDAAETAAPASPLAAGVSQPADATAAGPKPAEATAPETKPFEAPAADTKPADAPDAKPLAAVPPAEAAPRVLSPDEVPPQVVSPDPLAEADIATVSNIAALQERYNRSLHQGLLGMRSNVAAGGRVMGDNTDPWGMTWTKCTNLGIHLIATLVAEHRGLIQAPEAKQQIRDVVDILEGLHGHRGIFPENIQIKESGVVAEVVAGRSRFSSIDSAWVTVALSLVAARYKAEGDAVGTDAAALVARQDYRAFVGADGMLGAGFYVDVATNRKVEQIAFSYSDRNSEARPLILALVGMGQLPASAWNKTTYRWSSREGVPLAKGWHFSAFVEMTGALFFDEAKLAPRSLGMSHENYIEASVRVAQRSGHRMWGYAPACDAANSYAEFGLDRPDSVSPYAAALLTMTGNVRAVQNLGQVLAALPEDGSALADGLDPRTGSVSCGVARVLDQGLLFLALNADVVRGLVQKTAWYPSAERRLKAMDRKSAGPKKRPEPPSAVEPPMSWLSPSDTQGLGPALLALARVD
jgi:hypothetical protein